ncbi:uncharacterized protein [Littorina saxatilis]|uniref:uncharacterized protein n=1 Tax=Littorina saxatilis TaxID=31220 RepID=UPI0038B6640E
MFLLEFQGNYGSSTRFTHESLTLIPRGYSLVYTAVFSVFALAIGLITFAIHIYIFIHQSQWKDSLDDYLYCLSNKTVSEAVGSTAGPASCTVQHRPSLVAMEINMFAFFAAGIIMSSWSWTKASLCNWEHFLRKVFRKPEKPVKVHRQRMVAQAYDRRQENDGRVSVSYHTTHDDPCGMKFDLHSMSSNMSHMNNLAHNMPHLVQRHGGMMHPATGTFRRYSDSDIASVMSRRLSQGSAHGSGQQFVYMERDNSSNNGSVVGGGGWRRRRRRKRRKKRNAVQPILGPVLSGIGFGPTKGGGVLRRGSESSVLSKASAQGIRMHVTENQAYRLNGSSSSVTGYDRIPTGGTASGSDIRGPHASRSRRRKLPRLAPLSKHRRRSFSSSRSSLNQFGMGLHGMNQMNQMNQSFHSQFQQNPYAQLYGGYDYSQFYASLGYPQMAYPFWPYPYQFPPQAPPPPGVPPHPQTPQPPPPRPPSSTGTPAATDFSAFSANLNSGGTLPAATSSPDSERKRLLTSSTSRRSEVTIETQQTEMISMQKLKTTTEFEPPREPLSDDSIEDLNSSQLEDSAEEAEINEDTGDTTGETTGEAEVGV